MRVPVLFGYRLVLRGTFSLYTSFNCPIESETLLKRNDNQMSKIWTFLSNIYLETWWVKALPL